MSTSTAHSKRVSRSVNACFCAGWVIGTVFRSVLFSQSSRAIASARRNLTFTVGTSDSTTLMMHSR